jgi:3-phenylpropionate/trans-cinnamate dioxygenase ferredoxin reductase subunit
VNRRDPRRDHIVVVGAGAAGAAAASALRAEGYAGTITMVGDEAERPYDRPPLSKQVLNGSWDSHRTRLPGSLDVRWLTGLAAVSLDLTESRVHLGDGSSLLFDGLVIATGVRPRRLPFGHDLAGVHVLRSVSDCLALASDLKRGGRLVVIGAGFLGAEAAATARTMGLQVTLVDMLELPMLRQCGPVVAERLRDLHQGRGVAFVGGVGVSTIEGQSGRVTSVSLTDGRELAADTVLVAIGSDPATGWLEGSGLTLVDGVQCDSCCTAAPGVVAAGDVASWFHPNLGRHVRIEHRTNAAEQGMAAARSLLGNDEPFAPIPFAWTDQYDVRVQLAGFVDSQAEFHTLSETPEKLVGVYVVDDQVVAALGWNAPRDFTRARALVGTSADSPLLTHQPS